MVWFYQYYTKFVIKEGRKLSIPLWSDFIFCEEVRIYDEFRSFNPTMVWFYQSTPRPKRNFCNKLSIPLWSDFIKDFSGNNNDGTIYFQSHYGLILSEHYQENNGCPGTNLSIPLWSDFIEFASKFECFGEAYFQSHYGLILSLEELIKNEFYYSLSIPLWSDFISNESRIFAFFLSLDAFNPTMVWFYLLIVVRRKEVW